MQINLNHLTIRLDDDRLTLPLYAAETATPPLRAGELRDPDRLWARLRDGRDPLSAYLYTRLDAGARSQLEAHPVSQPLSESLQKLLAAELSLLIQQEESLYAPERFEHTGGAIAALVKEERAQARAEALITPPPARYRYSPEEAHSFFASVPSARRAFLNRRLLDIAYPGEIARRTTATGTLDAPEPLYHTVLPVPRLTFVITPNPPNHSFATDAYVDEETVFTNGVAAETTSGSGVTAKEDVSRQHVVVFTVEATPPKQATSPNRGLRMDDPLPEPKLEWVRWSLLERSVYEGLDGGATMRLNTLQGSRLRLELQSSDVEGRIAMLGFDCLLDRQTVPGDYEYKITCREVRNEDSTAIIGEPASFSITLCLRHPESRYMSYLPRLYREQVEPGAPTGAPFVGRFRNMSLFARFLLGIEESANPTWMLLGRLHHYFGAFTTSPEFLGWLSTWIGLALDENWPEMRRRLLLSRAVDLYTRRGTPGGLADYLEIYIGVRPTIQDQAFTGSFRLQTQAQLGFNTRLGESEPHRFTVTLRVPDPTKINEQIVREIINAEKPAHTDYKLEIIPLNA